MIGVHNSERYNFCDVRVKTEKAVFIIETDCQIRAAVEDAFRNRASSDFA
jgi:hypothetical protein